MARTQPAAALAAVMREPFLDDKRLVIVEGLLSRLARKGAGKAGKEALEALAAGQEDLPPQRASRFVETGAAD